LGGNGHGVARQAAQGVRRHYVFTSHCAYSPERKIQRFTNETPITEPALP
jgi:hypothetical protein